ncbi:hypothetical protein AMAG_07672 [Allomyces macrogynus ATCC 38327]|uniref:Uncharacterized protein n=1 Tax=Allomyces macrogynus (strain ATCC 38327) TaxID=578462 RepID=A0A0L0SIZ4_ALLM3|nr:hypothetical protein AMAG_07672 [Allomyces macrogynus ATCC 38327]|eukprot:KNE62456.1 hypothetical protein AMAG_07672 [Allomyces macrogynus ATCC 38327]
MATLCTTPAMLTACIPTADPAAAPTAHAKGQSLTSHNAGHHDQLADPRPAVTLITLPPEILLLIVHRLLPPRSPAAETDPHHLPVLFADDADCPAGSPASNGNADHADHLVPVNALRWAHRVDPARALVRALSPLARTHSVLWSVCRTTANANLAATTIGTAIRQPPAPDTPEPVQWNWWGPALTEKAPPLVTEARVALVAVPPARPKPIAFPKIVRIRFDGQVIGPPRPDVAPTSPTSSIFPPSVAQQRAHGPWSLVGPVPATVAPSTGEVDMIGRAPHLRSLSIHVLNSLVLGPERARVLDSLAQHAAQLRSVALCTHDTDDRPISSLPPVSFTVEFLSNLVTYACPPLTLLHLDVAPLELNRHAKRLCAILASSSARTLERVFLRCEELSAQVVQPLALLPHLRDLTLLVDLWVNDQAPGVSVNAGWLDGDIPPAILAAPIRPSLAMTLGTRIATHCPPIHWFLATTRLTLVLNNDACDTRRASRDNPLAVLLSRRSTLLDVVRVQWTGAPPTPRARPWLLAISSVVLAKAPLAVLDHVPIDPTAEPMRVYKSTRALVVAANSVVAGTALARSIAAFPKLDSLVLVPSRAVATLDNTRPWARDLFDDVPRLAKVVVVLRAGNDGDVDPAVTPLFDEACAWAGGVSRPAYVRRNARIVGWGAPVTLEVRPGAGRARDGWPPVAAVVTVTREDRAAVASGQDSLSELMDVWCR